MQYTETQFRKLKRSIPLILLAGVFIYFVLDRIVVNTFEKYPSIKYNEAIYTVVKETSNYKTTALIVDIKGRCFSIRASNYSLSPGSLSFYIEVGDSISRKSGSDTLYLFKKENNNVLEFELRCLE